MKVCALALLATFILLAADKRQAATALKAQSDFERVESVSRPRIPDAEVCMQSQAAALSVSSPEERSLLFYRKGYCNFAGAAASENPRQFLAAAAEFDKAIEVWPDRIRKSPKHAPPEPVSAALRVLAGIARLHAAPGAVAAGARQEIAAALESPSCKSDLMPATFCAELLAGGAQWLGWVALRGHQPGRAARPLFPAPRARLTAWVALFCKGSGRGLSMLPRSPIGAVRACWPEISPAPCLRWMPPSRPIPPVRTRYSCGLAPRNSPAARTRRWRTTTWPAVSRLPRPWIWRAARPTSIAASFSIAARISRARKRNSLAR